MAEINPSLLLQNHSLRPLHAALDLKKALNFPQFSEPPRPNFTTEGFAMERGPRFKEYSDLRERNLRLKRQISERMLPDRPVLTPQRKQVKFGSDFTTPPRRSRIPSVLAQSVPDFSSALRKENRRPSAAMAMVAERSATPPSKGGRVYGKVGGGSKSTNTAEKRSGGLMARKSYANLDELKKLGVAAGKEINGGKIGRGGIGSGKAVLGNRQF